MKSILATQRYRKSCDIANYPLAATHIAKAELHLRQQAGDELAGGIAGRLLQFADALHQFIGPLERLEQTLALERLAGTAGERQ